MMLVVLPGLGEMHLQSGTRSVAQSGWLHSSHAPPSRMSFTTRRSNGIFRRVHRQTVLGAGHGPSAEWSVLHMQAKRASAPSVRGSAHLLPCFRL